MAGLRFVTHATIADHVSTSAGCRVAAANDRSLLSRAACSTACQICTACAPRSPKVLQQWHAFATLRGPYVGCKSLAQRDAVEHFDGVHACVNLPIASGWMPDSAPRAIERPYSGENIRQIKLRSPFCDFDAFADRSGRWGRVPALLVVVTDAPDRGACSLMLSAQRAALKPDSARLRRC